MTIRSSTASVWGELASTCAQEKGVAGTVLYGYARDMDALIDDAVQEKMKDAFKDWLDIRDSK